MQALEVLFGDGCALERLTRDNTATSRRDQRKSRLSGSGDVRDTRRGRQAAHVRSGGVRGNNRGDGSYPRLRWRRLEESGDVSGQRVRTRRPGTECRFDGGGSRGVVKLIRRLSDLLNE